MHVCFLLYRKFPSNFSTAYNYYVQELNNNNISTSVICGKDKHDSTKKYERIDYKIIYRISASFRSSFSLDPTAFGLKAFWSLHQILSLENEPIDILHMIGFPNIGACIYPLPFLKTPPVKIIDIRATAVSHPVADFISRQMLRLQYRLYNNVIVLSRRVAERLFGYAHKAHILPVGADFKRFDIPRNLALRKQFKIRSREMCLIYVGSIHPAKRLDKLLISFKRIVNKFSDLKLLLVGGGRGLDSLINLARSLAIMDRVIFTGFIDYNEVPGYVKAADIGLGFIPGSIQYKDQPPIKTLEFLAAGLPVVVTPTPGNMDFVVDGYNGIVAHDDDSYAEAVERILCSPELMSRFSVRARNSILQYNYGDIVRNKLIPYYKSILKT